jgi:hypothetical protein
MSRFRADCSKCCGLCCVVPCFRSIQGFREDKRAEVPCVNLVSGHRCSIHATRELLGYSACRGFDCFGAGQWITQDLFNGASWSDAPDLAQPMFQAYRVWLPRFAAAALLEAALPYVRADLRRTIVERMEKLSSAATRDDDLPTDSLQLRRETLALIRTALRPGAGEK